MPAPHAVWPRLAALALAGLLLGGCGTPPGPAGQVDGGPVAGGPPRWVPEPGTTWQWQLTGRLDLSPDVAVYDVDGEQTSAETVAALHAAGRHAVCYLSVGSWEAFRPDAGAFPPEVLGAPLADFPDERWLDVRRLDLLQRPLSARLDSCRAKGFDAVEPDNVDGYANDSGFPLTAADQLRFNRWVAGAAHARGLSVALKNDLDQVSDLVDAFDFAVVEECVAYDECGALAPFVDAGKAVLHVEYDVATSQFCGDRALPGFSSLRKHVDLDASRATCDGG